MNTRLEDLKRLRDAVISRTSPHGQLPEGCSVEIEEREGGAVLVVRPWSPPMAPSPEPELEMVVGGLVVLKIGLTYLHSLNNSRGWHSGSYGYPDAVVGELFRGLEKWMWKTLDRQRKASMSDDVVTYKIISKVGPSDGGLYVIQDATYPDRETAEQASLAVKSSFVAVFPAWRATRVLRRLNHLVSDSGKIAAFDKIVELNATMTDTDSFSADVLKLLRLLGKDEL